MPHLKGPVPQAQAKEGPMPQLVKKRRSGWAVLAVGALVASILAVGAGPATAQPGSSNTPANHNPDFGADWSACVGSAGTHDAGFDDVDDDNVHAADINCIAAYGITLGIGDGTYAPEDHVNAFQMDLFVQRAGDLMGADGEAVSDSVLADVDPSAYVTRLHMAQLMFGLVDDIDDDVRINSRSNEIEFRDDSNAWVVVDDFFADAKAQVPIADSQVVGASYELGITRGTRGDGTLVSTAGSTFEPFANVTRGQMASFIARTLDHSNLRPEGLAIQRNSNRETMVSLRDSAFMPIEDARIDAFSSAYPDDAFDEDDGECEMNLVIDETSSFSTCEIDRDDFLTDDDGNVEFTLRSDAAAAAAATCTTDAESALRFEAASGGPGRTVWAWTGDLGDEVSEDTHLAELEDVGRPVGKAGPDYALVSGGLPTGDELAQMGESVTFTLQLYSQVGGEPNADMDVAVGPDRSSNPYSLRIQKFFVSRVAGSDSDATEKTGNASDATAAINFNAAPGNWEFTATPGVPAGTAFHTPTDTVIWPNIDGEYPITLTNDDPNILATTDANPTGDLDVGVRFTLSAFTTETDLIDANLISEIVADGNHASLIATTDVAQGYVIFSDDAPDPHKVTGESASYRILTGSRTGNSVTVSVVDQYGDPMRNIRISVESDLDEAAVADDEATYPEEVDDTVQEGENNPDGNGTDSDTVGTFSTRRNGTYRIGYTYTATTAQTEMITPESVRIVGDDPSTVDVDESGFETSDTFSGTGINLQEREVGDAVSVYWTGDGTNASSAAVPILVGDVANRTVVVNEGPDPVVPMAYYYDDDDTFIVAGAGVSLEAFEAALAATIDDDSIRASEVEWSNYVITRPGRLSRTVWELTLSCS